MQYKSTIDVSTVTLSGIEEVTEIIRGYGTVSVNLAQAEITCIFEVGEGGVAVDLWDLRDELAEIETQLDGYGSYLRVPKPILVSE